MARRGGKKEKRTHENRSASTRHYHAATDDCIFNSRGVKREEDKRATTNVQHRFVLYFLLSFLLFFVLIDLKPFVLKGKVLGEKL